MKKDETQERNEQIAIMLGYKLVTPDMRRNPSSWYIKGNPSSYWQKDYPDKQDVLCGEKWLSYHSDWNWLMKSLVYITKLGWNWELIDFNGTVTEEECFSCSIFNLELTGQPNKIKHISSNPIEATFIAVSDFAKLHNNKAL
jgi:hypothetical protein